MPRVLRLLASRPEQFAAGGRLGGDGDGADGHCAHNRILLSSMDMLARLALRDRRRASYVRARAGPDLARLARRGPTGGIREDAARLLLLLAGHAG